MSNDREIEKRLVAKGAQAPRLTPDHINATIMSKDYHVFDGKTTVCCLTLRNGYHVIGVSSCVLKENFDPEIGKDVAFENARNEIWKLEGYLLQQLHPVTE